MIKDEIQFKDKTSEIISFDPKPHKYYWQELERPSVTSMTSALTPLAPLIQWSANESANTFKELIQAGKTYDEVQLLEYFEKIKYAHRKSLNESGVIGSFVHDAIENFIQHGDEPEFTNEQMVKSFSKFKEWYSEQQGLELIWTEKRVLSREFGFTGTLDALFKNGKGEYIIYDWKTSKSLNNKKNYEAQIFLYYLALKEMTDYNITKGVIVNCTKKGELNIKTFDLNDESIEIAKSCIKLFYFTNPKFNYKQGEK
jgi:ATP-dependent exoDNAse (exonuclease V) beta subunit